MQRHIHLASMVALGLVLGCGNKGAREAAEAVAAATTTSTTGTGSSDPNVVASGGSGAAVGSGILQPGGQEAVGSLDPHPATCGSTCAAIVPANDNDTTREYNCSAPVGHSVPCEGLCFVAESVTPRYDTEPPSSGPIYPRYDYQWGEHQQPLSRGYYVHNLAHGFIVIAYNCPNGCSADLDAIREVMQVAAGARIILTPDPLLTGSPFAALAWTWTYTFDHTDPAALTCFIAQHNKNGWPH